MTEASDFDLANAIASLRQHWKLLAVGACVGVLLAVAYILLTERTYKVDIVVTSAADASPLQASGLSAALGGLSFLGGNLFNQATVENEAIALLHSKAVSQKLIVGMNLLPVLFSEQWDSEGGQWNDARSEIPTMSEGVRKLQEEVFRIKRDRELGIITISAYWKDREQAADWVTGLVAIVNEKMRSNAIEESTRSFEYLSEELQSNRNVESRQMIFELMQSNLNRSAMASAKPEFAFRIIDPPVMPDDDQYVRPKIALSLVGFTLLGLILGLMVSMSRQAFRRLKH